MKQFFYYVQEQNGRKWESIFRTDDDVEAMALREINATSGRKFRILARFEEATA